MRFKCLRNYLLFTGLLCNLALLYGVYRVTSQFFQYESLPVVLNHVAHKVSDVPVLKSVSPALSNVAQSLNQSSALWAPFKREQWPMVGPDFSDQAVNVDLMAESTLYVSDAKSLLNALKKVQPGETILVADGEYLLQGKRFMTSSEIASESHPIILRAEHPGQAKLLLSSTEGIFLNHPYWTITGFRFIGKCSNSACEHAIHIVGDANHTTVSNNEFIDFNAALKINGSKDQYPDNGTINNNHFHFTQPRNTRSSVTPVNLDHANNWVITHNIIRDFVKTGGNRISYGAFIKGGAINGIIENNLVICNTSQNQNTTSQVGLSIGGGGMNNRRDYAPYEAKNIIIRNNIISNCNDVGIYINKGQESLINNNTLFNTSGIDIRFQESSAFIVNNLLSGKLRERDNGQLLVDSGNIVYGRSFFHNYDELNNVFLSPETGNFAISNNSVDIHKNAVSYPTQDKQNITDFCGQPLKGGETFIGAFSDKKGCFSAN